MDQGNQHNMRGESRFFPGGHLLPASEKWKRQANKKHFRRESQKDIFIENKIRECQDKKRWSRVFKYARAIIASTMGEVYISLTYFKIYHSKDY